MMIVQANQDSEAGVPTSQELFDAIQIYNEQLQKAGALVDHGKLCRSSEGARVKFSGSDRMVIDGPFTETKELVGGFYIIEAATREEAIQWVLRAPHLGPPSWQAEIEIRRILTPEEFARDVR